MFSLSFNYSGPRKFCVFYDRPAICQKGTTTMLFILITSSLWWLFNTTYNIHEVSDLVGRLHNMFSLLLVLKSRYTPCIHSTSCDLSMWSLALPVVSSVAKERNSDGCQKCRISLSVVQTFLLSCSGTARIWWSPIVLLPRSLGTASLSVVYVAQLLSASFLPTWLIWKFGQRTTIAVSMFLSSVFIAAQYYPIVYTLVPAAAVYGTVASPLMTAQYTILTRVGWRARSFLFICSIFITESARTEELCVFWQVQVTIGLKKIYLN